MERINFVNSENLSYTLGENQFTSLTFEEFTKKYLMTAIPAETFEGEEIETDGKAVDWRKEGIVNPIRN